MRMGLNNNLFNLYQESNHNKIIKKRLQILNIRIHFLHNHQKY